MLARSIATTGEAAVIYRAIAKAAATLLGASVARVWVNDAADGILTAAGSYGVPPDTEQSLLDMIRIGHGVGVPGRIALSRTAEFIPDARADGRWVNRRFIDGMGLQAYAGLPLIAGGEVVGVLSILFNARRDFTDDERALAAVLADLAAVTVRNVRWYENRRRVDALEAVTRLARAAAHELNNPLAVVLGQAQLMRADLGDRPQIVDRLQRIQEAAIRLARVVRQMSLIVRLEANTMSPDLPSMLDLKRSSEPDGDPFW